MVKKYVWVLMAFLLLGCENEEIPSYILSSDKMTNVLMDIHIAEAKTIMRGLPPDSGKMLFRLYEDSVFKKHHITRAKFDSSYKYYTSHMDVFNKVYASVVDSLSLREARDKIN